MSHETNVRSFEREFGGRKLVIEVGRFAQQAHGSCTVQYGDTVVLATVVMGEKAREGMDYFPLVVDYEERLYAAGKIKGSRFIKREGRPSDEAVLTARLVDRSLRPLFDNRIRNEIQIVLTVLCWDGENDPDFPSLLAASTALSISHIPWETAVAGVKIGIINNEWVLNPTYNALEKSSLELMAAYTEERNLIMVEAGAHEVPEEKAIEAIRFGRKHVGKLIQLIEEVRTEVGRQKVSIASILNSESAEEEEESAEEAREHEEMVRRLVEEHAEKYLFSDPLARKYERKAKINELIAFIDDQMKEKQIGKEKRQKALARAYEYIEEYISRAIVREGKRVDGRRVDEVRPLSASAGVLPRVHGSGLFNRGETQVLSIVTLGAPGDEQILDTMEEHTKKRYMHHYNFPGFSVGEPKRITGPGRREIGHGALAEKALVSVLPSKEDFPYTIRVVSEVLGSNGSSSMASVCGSTLALMDAGVPIKKPVAGVAMGLASEGDRFQVLTDLQDLEDGPGGMDFKIAGTRDGVTAIQMDTKTRGLSMDIVEQTFQQARDARMHILDAMAAVIAEPRSELSPYAPRILTLNIDPAKIRDIIGPGGKVINAIIDATDVAIDIEDDGLVMVTAANEESARIALRVIQEIVREFSPGELVQGVVTRVESYGAFVKIEPAINEIPEGITLPANEGMIHISELAPFRVEQVEDIVKVGDKITAKVKEVDSLGRISLTLLGTDFPYPAPTSRPSHPRRPHPGRNGREQRRDHRSPHQKRRDEGRDRPHPSRRQQPL